MNNFLEVQSSSYRYIIIKKLKHRIQFECHDNLNAMLKSIVNPTIKGNAKFKDCAKDNSINHNGLDYVE